MGDGQVGASADPKIAWSTLLGQSPIVSPVTAGDLLFVAAQEFGPAALHSTLHVLSLDDGSTRWQRAFEYALVSGLASARAPVSVIVSTTSTDLIYGEGALVSLDAAGEELYHWAAGVQRLSAPAAAGNVVCVTVDARTLLVLDLATGTERAEIPLEVNASLSAPTLADDVVYIPCRGPHLLAVGLDGQPCWRFDAAGSSDTWLDRTPAVAGERVFAALTSGVAVALRARDGSLVWRTDVGVAGKSLSAPATDGERLFVGARDGLHALDLADGREVWISPTLRRIAAAPVAVEDVVYAVCHDHHLYALDAATGQELWRYEIERRIEVSPILADCGEPVKPCVLIVDRGGTLTAVARPLNVEEYEAAGYWDAAASGYADLGQIKRGAELLEAHGEPRGAAEMWRAAGELERAAAQYELAGAWKQAAELWLNLGRPLKEAEALEKYARSLELESEARSAEECAATWDAAAQAFGVEGEAGRAQICWREAARCLQQPVITLDVQHEELVLEKWSRLRFIARNDGYGPARNLTIRASGDEFEGQVMDTQQIPTLRAGRAHVEWLDVRPLEYGETVPLRVQLEYMDNAGKRCSHKHTIYIAVARTPAEQRQKRTTTRVFTSDISDTDRKERAQDFLRDELAKACEHLLLVQERQSEYVMDVDVPLQLVKQERDLMRRIADLEARLAQMDQEGTP
jgi:outer membrane protein assembly factor BamB/tetratricopeptide (TPR) repeat protein